MDISKQKLKQIIKEELESIISEKYVPYTTGDLQNLLNSINNAPNYTIQVIVNGQTMDIDEVWNDDEDRTLNMTVR
jgi:intracellular sulfur oxidation DsrE/DsrF family protein